MARKFRCEHCGWEVQQSPGYSGTVVCDNRTCPHFDKPIGFAPPEKEIVTNPEAIAHQGAALYTNELMYVPFIAQDGRVGYAIYDHHGSEEFIYLNPSQGENDRNVFIYQGPENDPVQDWPLHFYNVATDWSKGDSDGAN